MGRHRNTIIGWEKQAEVPPGDAAAYLAALETFRLPGAPAVTA